MTIMLKITLLTCVLNPARKKSERSDLKTSSIFSSAISRLSIHKNKKSKNSENTNFILNDIHLGYRIFYLEDTRKLNTYHFE